LKSETPITHKFGANKQDLTKVMKRVRACKACKDHLPHGPRPALQANKNAKLLIVGQAPGIKAHRSGIPWNDASGDRLREWLGLSQETFYNEKIVAILPMGFCYPGRGGRGDLPPRKECFPLWHKKLTSLMPNLRLVLLVGGHAQSEYLKSERKSSLTETVRAWRDYLPHYLPLPHPSPLNNIWLHKNRWFQTEELPNIKGALRAIV
jgi:uracil-DNA glycosylase family 4